MAKLEKMDPKETPKVIALGVLAVGMFGYFGMTMMAPPKRPPAPPAEAKETPKAGEPVAAEQDAELVKVAMAKLVGTSNVYNPDPFRPARLPKAMRQPVSPQNPAPVKRAGTYREYNGLQLPPVSKQSAPEKPTVTAQQPPVTLPAAAPEPLPRPELTLTGVVDAQDGPDLAVAQMGTENLFLKVGDTLPNDYKIIKVVVEGEKVEPGVWIANNPKKGAKDQFKIALGGKTPARSAGPVVAIKQ